MRKEHASSSFSLTGHAAGLWCANPLPPSELLGCKMRIMVCAVWEYCRHWACYDLWSLDGRSSVYFKAKKIRLGNVMGFTLQLYKCKVSLLSCK